MKKEVNYGIVIVPLFNSDGDQRSIARILYRYPDFDLPPDFEQFTEVLEIDRISDINNKVDIEVGSLSSDNMEYYYWRIYEKESPVMEFVY